MDPGSVETALCEADRDSLNPDLDPADNRMADSQGWSYDAAGNVVGDPEGRAFTYDAENKQIAVENSQSQSVGEYYFDGDGKRVKKHVPSTGEVTVFVYDAGGKLIGEYSSVGETVDPKVQYLTADHLGSPRINTDENGLVTSRTDYMPYGEEIIGLGNRSANEAYVADDVRQGFTGYERDGETALDHAQARTYAPRLGRFNVIDPIFSSVDPTLPQTWNRYAYCLNNPYFYIDPSGLIWVYADEGNIRRFRWYDNEKDVPEGWTPYTGSNYFIGADKAVWLGAKGGHRFVDKEEAALGQLDEFLRGPESPLSEEEKRKLTYAFMDRVMNEHWEDKLIAELAGGSLGAFGESGLRALANVLLRAGARKAETGLLAGMLREAVKGKGNFGIGSATVDQAEALGRAWVGDGYIVASDGLTLISKDGLRQFRPPSVKPKLGKVQANLEWRVKNRGNGRVMPTSI